MGACTSGDKQEDRQRRPPAHNPGQAGQQRPGAPAGATLPPGWRTGFDQNSGKFYYINDATHVTQWHPPPAVPPPPGQSLPAGWRSQVDPSTQRTYYVNDRLGLTQWQPPQAQQGPADLQPRTMTRDERQAALRVSMNNNMQRLQAGPPAEDDMRMSCMYGLQAPDLWVRAVATDGSGDEDFLRLRQLRDVEVEKPYPNDPERQAIFESVRDTLPPTVFWFPKMDKHRRIWFVRGEDVEAALRFEHKDVAYITSLDFGSKLLWFEQQMVRRRASATGGKGNAPDETIDFIIKRSELLDDTFREMMVLEKVDLRKHFTVVFQNETTRLQDAGGITREWISVTVSELFDPKQGIFVTNEGGAFYHLNPEKPAGEWHRFAGRFLAKALFEKFVIGVHLAPFLLMQLMDQPVGLDELPEYNESEHQSLVAMREGSDVDAWEIYFEDIPGYDGVSQQVDDHNKEDFIELKVDSLLEGQVKDQLAAFREGFWELVPAVYISVFDFQQMTLVLSGDPKIDLSDWKRNTQYSGKFKEEKEEHHVVDWFWETLSIMDVADLSKLLMFVTSTSVLPNGGFEALEKRPGEACMFTLNGVDLEPDISGGLRAHTCTCLLYTSPSPRDRTRSRMPSSA
eukprot:TRINITY_DN15214_c0_g1_i2.p1 TRINITY_DN15214_c0_g1~~TRINITY_DN15214_c0_g1_i2.p1  ORF type:complete len:625 (-),score=164.35 TRINITY_DN15214_c0_g1_i2:43-1917(-)